MPESGAPNAAKSQDLSGLAKSLNFATAPCSLNIFRCCVCGQVSSDALETKCGHLYCSECLDEVLNKSKKCPLDGVLLTKEEVHKNLDLESKVKMLPVYCLYKVNGCDVIVPLSNISKHIQQCKFATIKCPQGCDAPIRTSNLQNHLRFLCAFRHVPCEHCDKTFVLACQHKHFEECLRFPIQCPNQCGVHNVPREEISDHLEVCIVKLRPCRFQHLGCFYQGHGITLRMHEEDVAKHFKLMADSYSFLNLQFDILMQGTKGNVLLMQNDNCALRESVKELMKQFERLQGLNENITEKLANLRVHVRKILQTQETRTEKEHVATDGEQSEETEHCVKSQLKTFSREMMEAIHEDLIDKIQEHDQRLQALSQNVASDNYTGVLIWRITGYAKRKAESISRTRAFLFSDPFFTERYGYQLCAKVFLGGDGDARGTHLSLYIIVMRGPWDDILPWPFRHKFTISLLDQRNVSRKEHLIDYFSSNSSSSFERPTMVMNVGAGVTKFLSHATIELNDTYLCNDTIYLKIAVLQDQHKSKK